MNLHLKNHRLRNNKGNKKVKTNKGKAKNSKSYQSLETKLLSQLKHKMF